MKLIGKAFAAGLVAAAVALGACSSQHGSGGTGGGTSNTPGTIGSLGGNAGNTGSIGMHLDLAPGVSVTTLTWTITNGTNSYGPSPVNIGDAQSVEWVAGGILEGSGYNIIVTGSDSAGDPCSGSSGPNVTVTAGATTQAVLAVICTVSTDSATAADVHTGSIEVDASVNLVNQGAIACPGITSFSINPAEIVLGQTSQLNLATTGPTPIITWSVVGLPPNPGAGGTFSPSASSASPTFLCDTGSAQVRVTATVSLAADAGGSLCVGKPFTAMSALVNCEGNGIVCTGGTTACGPDGGQVCVNTQTDANNCGTCGHVCPVATPNCTAGTCVLAPPPPPVPCTGFTGGVNTPAGCVRCAASPNGVCTTTEAIVVNHDIAKNGQLGGNPTNGSCYTCLIANACLDGSGTGAPPAGNNSGTAVTNSECGDPNGAGTNPPFDNPNVSLTNVANCLDALTCALTSNGANPASECSLSQLPASVSNCYCGANTGSACLASTSAPIGVCAAKIDTDIGSTDPTTVLSHFTDPTFSPGGVGLAILNCGLTAPATPPSAAKCPSCFN